MHIEQKNIEKIVKQWVCTTKKFDGNICSYIKSEQKRKKEVKNKKTSKNIGYKSARRKKYRKIFVRYWGKKKM